MRRVPYPIGSRDRLLQLPGNRKNSPSVEILLTLQRRAAPFCRANEHTQHRVPDVPKMCGACGWRAGSPRSEMPRSAMPCDTWRPRVVLVFPLRGGPPRLQAHADLSSPPHRPTGGPAQGYFSSSPTPPMPPKRGQCCSAFASHPSLPGGGNPPHPAGPRALGGRVTQLAERCERRARQLRLCPGRQGRGGRGGGEYPLRSRQGGWVT